MRLALPRGSPAPSEQRRAMTLFPTGIKPILAEDQRSEQWRCGYEFVVVGPRNLMCGRRSYWTKAAGVRGAVLGKGRRRYWRSAKIDMALAGDSMAAFRALSDAGYLSSETMRKEVWETMRYKVDEQENKQKRNRAFADVRGAPASHTPLAVKSWNM